MADSTPRPDRSLIGAVAPLSALLAGVVFLLMGAGLLSTLLAVRGGSEGFGSGWIGFIMSSYFAGFLVGNYAAPLLIHRVGHIRAFAFCASLVACLALFHGLFVNPWTWLVFRGVTGAVLVTLYTLIESWLNAQAPADRRGQVFAVYMMANLGALAVGQQFLRIDATDALTLFGVAAVLICVSVLPVSWTRLTQPEVTRPSRMPLRDLLRIAPIAAVGAVFSGLTMGAFWGLTPAFAASLGLDEIQVANVMTAAIVGGAALQIPLGRFSDRSDRRLALIVVAAGAAVSALLVALAVWLNIGAALAMLMFGGFAFSIYPICAAHLIDRLPPGQTLPGTGALLLAHGLGSACGPILAGQLMETVGSAMLPAYFAANLGVISLIVWLVYRRHRAPDPQPAHFVPMLRTTPEVLSLLPDEAPDASRETATSTDNH